jgi:hypothetical protein
MKLNTNDITITITKDLCSRGFPIFLSNYQGQGMQDADVFGINNNGYVYEYEVKVSRSDFKAEFRHKEYKHNNLKNRDCIKVYDKWIKGKRTDDKYSLIHIPNRYYFACSEGLIKLDEIPEYAGLIYIKDGEITEIKNAPLLHRNKANDIIYKRVATILSQRVIFGESYMTHRVKESIIKNNKILEQ